MTALKKFQSFHLDLIVSASLFSMGHIVQFGWSTTDFIFIFCSRAHFRLAFRKTNRIYYSMATHVAWNSFLALYIPFQKMVSPSYLFDKYFKMC